MILFIFLFLSCYIKKLPFFWSFNQQQAANQAKENELDLAKQQAALEDGRALLWIKLQRNQEQALRAEAQAESARHQAGGLEKVITLSTAARSEEQCFFEG